MPTSRFLFISDTPSDLHSSTHLEEPSALHYLSSPTIQTKAIYGCDAAGEIPPELLGAGLLYYRHQD